MFYARFFIVAYILSAPVLLIGLQRTEIFPLFSWFLFPYIPNTEDHLTARVTEIDGVAIDPPMDLMDSPLSQKHRGRSWVALQSAINSEEDRQLLERAYISKLGGTVKYEIGRVRFNPLDRWRTGKVSYERVADFSTD